MKLTNISWFLHTRYLWSFNVRNDFYTLENLFSNSIKSTHESPLFKLLAVLASHDF